MGEITIITGILLAYDGNIYLETHIFPLIVTFPRYYWDKYTIPMRIYWTFTNKLIESYKYSTILGRIHCFNKKDSPILK